MTTIDFLAEEIAGELGVASSDVLKKVLDVSKKVMRDIGKEFCCQILTESFKIKKDKDGFGKIRIPENMLLPLVDLTIDQKVSYQHSHGQFIGQQNSFHVTSQEIIFDYIESGEAEITYYSHYVDEEGALMVGDIEREAVYQSVMAEILKGKVINPLKDKVLLYREDARNAINMARGEYNSLNKLRTRSYLRVRDGQRKSNITEWIKVENRYCKNCQ